MSKPKIFIGSSVEGLTIAYAVHQNLNHDAEITVWPQSVFELSQTAIESLEDFLGKVDFAIFVFTPDDVLKIRNTESLTVRDNVIFELGLFIGKIGRARTFIVSPEKTELHIPTDLLGVTTGKYETNRTDGNEQAATGAVCNQIRIQIKKQGPLYITDNENSTQSEIVTQIEVLNKNENDWWPHYFNKEYSKAIEIIEVKIVDTVDETKKDDLIMWKSYVKFKFDRKGAVKEVKGLLEKNPEKKLFYIDSCSNLLRHDELKLAKEIIEKGLEKFGDDETLISCKADYLEKIGKSDEAIKLLVDSQPEHSESLSLKLANLYEGLEKKQVEDAFFVIHKAYLNNQDSESLTYRLGRLASETERHTLELYLFDKLTIKYSEDSSYWGYLGNAFHRLELFNKAMTAYKKGVALSEGKAVWILSNIGNMFKNLGLNSLGLNYFEKSLTIDPKHAYTLERVGIITRQLEEEGEKVRKLLKEGLKELFEPSEPLPF